MDPADLFEALVEAGVVRFTGVPDALLQPFSAYLSDHAPPGAHDVATQESAAIAWAADSRLASGESALVYLPDSGLGSAAAPLIARISPAGYGVPLLLLVGWRSAPGHSQDPAVLAQGKAALALLEALRIPYSVLTPDPAEARSAIRRAVTHLHLREGPYALLVLPELLAPPRVDMPGQGRTLPNPAPRPAGDGPCCPELLGCDCWTALTPVPVRIVEDAIEALDGAVGNRRALILTTEGFQRRGLLGRVQERLAARAASALTVGPQYPNLDLISRLAESLDLSRFDVIVAAGGGSIMDIAKVLSSGAAADRQRLTDILSGKEKLSIAGPKPVIAIPTTAGTGSEVTPFATLWDPQGRRKYSLDDPKLLPELAILDSRLTLTLPREITLYSALDAVSHALESIWSKRFTPEMAAVAIRSLRLSLGSLVWLIQNLQDLPARREMHLASLAAGIAISRTRTGIAHAISYPLTIHFGVPHGLAAGFTLPRILRLLSERDDGRLGAAAFELGFAGPDLLAAELERIFETCRVGEHLRRYVPSAAALLGRVDEMFQPGRADNTMLPLNREHVLGVLRESYPS